MRLAGTQQVSENEGARHAWNLVSPHRWGVWQNHRAGRVGIDVQVCEGVEPLKLSPQLLPIIVLMTSA